MGYGTILAPILLIIGFELLVVVPAILISQALAGTSAAIFHQKYNNVDLHPTGKDGKIVFIIIGAGILATIAAVFLAIQLNEVYLKLYIGILVLIMGLMLLTRIRFKLSLDKVTAIGILSGFNKALTGGGFGPVVTSGQIISGNGFKSSIGISTASKGPICIIGFFSYVVLNGLSNVFLPILLILGALLATPIGPLGTKKLEVMNAQRIVGIMIVTLGLFILVKIFL